MIKEYFMALEPKGIRQRKGIKYEINTSIHSKSIYIGRYDTYEEAVRAYRDYRLNRFIDGVSKYEDDIEQGKFYLNEYVVYPDGRIFNTYGIEMIGGIDRGGYRTGILGKKNVHFHRAVAECFIKNEENKPCVNHIDGNKANNNAYNLEWCTRSENTIHAYKIGLEKKVVGEDKPTHKLTEKAVKYIREHYVPRGKQNGAKALAKMFSVDYTTICNVANKKSWRYLV